MKQHYCLFLFCFKDRGETTDPYYFSFRYIRFSVVLSGGGGVNGVGSPSPSTSSASIICPSNTSNSSPAKLLKTELVLQQRPIATAAVVNGGDELSAPAAVVETTTTDLSPDSPQAREPDSSTGKC